MRSVSVRLADLIKTTIPLGYVGENEYTKVIFDCKKVFDDYPSAIQALTVKAPKGDPYPVVTTREDDYVVWEVEGSSLAYDGSGEFQLTFTSGNVIVKSYTGRTRIEKSIVPVGEAPDAITDWITGANNVLDGIPQEISDGIDVEFGEITATAETLDPDESATASFDGSTKVLSMGIPKGEKGDPGDDGYSPSASVSKSGSTATISITDKDGTTTATVSDGDPTSLIDDTAGDGDTGKTWSADKLVDELGDKYELPSSGIPSSDMASAVQASLGKADTAYQKPSGGIPADDIASGVIPSVTGKADKVSSATNGNFAGLDSNGNLTDSGHKHSDYLTSHQDITGKADKVSSATSGDFAGLDGNGNLTDSGKKASDFVASSSFYATEMPMASDDSSKVGTEIGNLKSALDELDEVVNGSTTPATYTLPSGYESANYSNAAGTNKFKYENGELVLKKAAAAGSITTSNANLTTDSTLMYDWASHQNDKVTIEYDNGNLANVAQITFRFYDSNINNNTSSFWKVPVGTGSVDVSISDLAENAESSVDPSTKPYIMIRDISLIEGAQSYEVVTTTIKGFKTEGASTDGLADKVEDLETTVGSLADDVTEIQGDVEGFSTEIESISADVENLSETVDGLDEIINGATTPVTYSLPTGYESANYSNVAGTNKFKYENGELVLNKAAAAGSITTSNANLTINSSLMFDWSSNQNAKVSIDYDNENLANVAQITFRFYDSNINNNTSSYWKVPVGEGSVDVSVSQLAQNAEASVDASTKPYIMIRDISLIEGAQSYSQVSVSIKGFITGGGTSEGLSDRVEDLETSIGSLEDDVTELQSDVESLSNIKKTKSSIAGNAFAYKPWCAHLFLNTVNDAASDTIVPSQSLYDIEISKRLGFYVIEANTHRTYDGKFVCFHGSNGKFAGEFVAASGSSYTDAQIQDTNCSTVTLDWIKTNVVYKAKYPKMQVPPPTLEEFLYACKKNVMVPLINYVHVDEIGIADKIMGKDNYILYSAPKSVRQYSDAPFLAITHFTTKQDILDWIDDIGTPCIWSALHPEDFTKSEWADIVQAVHAKGALINMAAGYMSAKQTQEWLDIGFDFGSSGWDLNPVISGNIVNLTGDDTFGDFTITGGSVADGVVTLNQNGTIVPQSAIASNFLSGSWLDVTFVGDISVSMGRWLTHGGATEMSATESRTVHLSTYWLNTAPTFEVKALSSNTVIESITFKVSKL